MRRFLVNCRNHRGRTRDVAITAASEAEAIAYLRQKGFTDCAARGAIPGSASDDATTAVRALPDPDASAEPAPRARPPGNQARRQGTRATEGAAERTAERRSTADAEARRDTPEDRSPWWATAGGVARRTWKETRRLAAIAWSWTRAGCARSWSWTRAACAKCWRRVVGAARKALKRERPKDESPAS